MEEIPVQWRLQQLKWMFHSRETFFNKKISSIEEIFFINCYPRYHLQTTYSSKLLSRHASGFIHFTTLNIFFVFSMIFARSRPTKTFITRLPPGTRNFSAILTTSRQSIALWYWSSSFRPVVRGATSEVMRSQFRNPISLRYCLMTACVSGAVISPT